MGGEPDVVDGDFGFLFVGVGPAAAVFVLDVFPFGADAGFEEVVVGFDADLGGWGDVVLQEKERYS